MLRKKRVMLGLVVIADQFQGTVKQLPTRDEITMPIQEQLIVELYSK